MKRIFAGLVLCVLLFGGFFCVTMYRWFHQTSVVKGNNLSLRIRETDDRYLLTARYHPSNTENVQAYLDEQLSSNVFRKARVQGNITLDDNMHFFVRASPGRLLIEFDRDENSDESFQRIKAVGQGLKGKIIR